MVFFFLHVGEIIEGSRHETERKRDRKEADSEGRLANRVEVLGAASWLRLSLDSLQPSSAFHRFCRSVAVRAASPIAKARAPLSHSSTLCPHADWRTCVRVLWPQRLLRPPPNPTDTHSSPYFRLPFGFRLSLTLSKVEKKKKKRKKFVIKVAN